MRCRWAWCAASLFEQQQSPRPCRCEPCQPPPRGEHHHPGREAAEVADIVPAGVPSGESADAASRTSSPTASSASWTSAEATTETPALFLVGLEQGVGYGADGRRIEPHEEQPGQRYGDVTSIQAQHGIDGGRDHGASYGPDHKVHGYRRQGQRPYSAVHRRIPRRQGTTTTLKMGRLSSAPTKNKQQQQVVGRAAQSTR